jgi:hypothetical protein
MIEMMPRHARLLVAAACALLAAACDESPTRPDPRIPPQVGPPTTLMFQPCEYGGRIAVCPVRAIWGHLYSSDRIVTQEARWSSSAANVVRIAAPGMLEAIAPGDADVTVSFNERDVTAKFRVFGEGPPWHVARGVEYHIRVVNEIGAPLDGVLVEIIAGGNAGMEATSDRFGSAIFRGDIVCGPITVRGTKPGYREWTGSAIRCGRAGNGLWGSETVGPVRMIPVS